MNVSVVIPTRGNVALRPVVESLPGEWEIVVYDNGAGVVRVIDPAHSNGGRDTLTVTGRPDLAVYARYAAIEWASHDLILTQDDDVIVSDPQAIVDTWRVGAWNGTPQYLCANMPQEFRHDGYTDSCLVGFGACFHRDIPTRSFDRFWQAQGWGSHPLAGLNDVAQDQRDMFLRTCDVTFTTLTQRVLVDVPITHREFASDPDRMWKQPTHVAERARMLELARKVRDA